MYADIVVERLGLKTLATVRMTHVCPNIPGGRIPAFVCRAVKRLMVISARNAMGAAGWSMTTTRAVHDGMHVCGGETSL